MRNESERMEQDSVRFADLNSVKVSIDIHRNQVKSISDNLIGVFFEDLNYAADGGLYAELIQIEILNILLKMVILIRNGIVNMLGV